jgi:hypothetical protein
VRHHAEDFAILRGDTGYIGNRTVRVEGILPAGRAQVVPAVGEGDQVFPLKRGRVFLRAGEVSFAVRDRAVYPLDARVQSVSPAGFRSRTGIRERRCGSA